LPEFWGCDIWVGVIQLPIRQTQTADIININLMKTAGFSQAIEIANIMEGPFFTLSDAPALGIQKLLQFHNPKVY
jgi:hypothetical protein